MLGEEKRIDEEGSFSKASILKRIAIVLAGGIVNILFGILAYFVIISCINGVYIGLVGTKNFIVAIAESLKELFTGKVNADQLMGPVGISGVVSQTEGIVDYIYMMAMISLSLGVTNLLPFPPLDGGKVVILIVEAIRGKPMKEKLEIGLQLTRFCDINSIGNICVI
jgi:regulator of sigma E protease